MKICSVCDGPIHKPTTNFVMLPLGSTFQESIKYFYHLGKCKDEVLRKCRKQGAWIYTTSTGRRIR